MALRDRLSPNARPPCRPGPVSAAPPSSLRAPRQRSPCRGVWGRPWAPHAGASLGRGRRAGSSLPAELLSASSLGRHAPLGIPLHAACSACPPHRPAGRHSPAAPRLSSRWSAARAPAVVRRRMEQGVSGTRSPRPKRRGETNHECFGNHGYRSVAPGGVRSVCCAHRPFASVLAKGRST